IALLVGTVVVAVPAARLAGWIAVLAAALASAPPRWASALFRAVRLLSPWAMIEVFLLGAVVSHGRLAALGSVDIGPSFVALAAAVLVTAAIDWGVDREAVWRALVPPAPSSGDDARPPAPWIGCAACDRVVAAGPGNRCPRCGSILIRGK